MATSKVVSSSEKSKEVISDVSGRLECIGTIVRAIQETSQALSVEQFDDPETCGILLQAAAEKAYKQLYECVDLLNGADASPTEGANNG